MTAQPDEGSDLTESLMDVSLTFIAVATASMVEADTKITAPQLRVLMVLTAVGSTNLSGLATDLGVDASAASRACEQLVQARMVRRTQDPSDRRHVDLRLTATGKAVVERLLARRRELFADMTERLSPMDSIQLKRGLEIFSGTARRTLEAAHLKVGLDAAATAHSQDKP